MGLIELFLIAVGLSMDAFAVALCKGLQMRRLDVRAGAVLALFFGAFQALMPLIGWALGTQFASSIQQVDHWIAAGLLFFIGGRMVYEALRGDEAAPEAPGATSLKELLILSVATSIDALAVGVTFAFLRVAILPAAALIGVTTFCLSFLGVAVGNRFGVRYKNKAELAGGAVLIFIGVKILLEHLGVF